ncbi:MAG: prepilin-type N-terminal cleavage/methylation domain-containing protein [Planctomycetes bacterium]|nr:prepilin-type N-terminal cleavage/methylation domain-containing protein [Planctomycetota bacterium]
MRRSEGFTLVEVLVALVVAVAAMALLSQGFTTGARASVASQYVTRAALLAQRVLTDFETGQLDLTSNQSGGFDEEPDFTYATTSTTGDVTGLTRLDITVKWKERNDDRTYVLTRLMRGRSASTTSSSSPSTTPGTTPPK